MNQTPLVSIVIPTRNRPQLVCRAIASVLEQTFREFEIVVVIDGPDPATVAAIHALGKPCIRTIALAEGVGGSEARNVGVRQAKGAWIAFLDDDDEWLPQKLEMQLDAIESCGGDINFSACRYHFLDGISSSPQPEVFPRPGQNIGEYIFCEISKSGHRRGIMLPSTWLVKRDLCVSSPFTRGLRKYQDPDWLLKAFNTQKITPCFISEPYTLVHAEADRNRVSTTAPDWTFSFEWANQAHLKLTPKAKGYVYGTLCAYEAKQRKDAFKVLLFLWRQCDRSVRFTPDLLLQFARALFSACTFRNRYIRTSWLWLRSLLRMDHPPAREGQGSSGSLASPRSYAQ